MNRQMISVQFLQLFLIYVFVLYSMAIYWHDLAKDKIEAMAY